MGNLYHIYKTYSVSIIGHFLLRLEKRAIVWSMICVIYYAVVFVTSHILLYVLMHDNIEMCIYIYYTNTL